MSDDDSAIKHSGFVNRICFAAILAVSFILPSVANELTIFWTLHDFGGWWLPWLLPASLRIAAFLGLLSTGVACLLAWRSRLQRNIFTWRVFALPLLLIGPTLVHFAFLSQNEMAANQFLIPAAISLVFAQFTLACWAAARSVQGWIGIAVGAFICCSAGALMGIVHIIAVVNIT